MRNLLLLSSSREGESGYLEQASQLIDLFLTKAGREAANNALFIPFAGVSVSYDDYLHKVQEALASIPVKLNSIHTADDPSQAIKHASAIFVAGGNTFHLLHQLYQFDLIGQIREKVLSGTPYIGWSAGSNIATPSIKTTNDMPIVQPPSFHALHLVPFQINPHYLDQHPPGFNGETREQRLQEFMIVNPDTPIVGLPEGSGIEVVQENSQLVGNKTAFHFINGKKTELAAGEPLNHLLTE